MKTLSQQLNDAIAKVERSNAEGSGGTGVQILALQELCAVQSDIIKTLINEAGLDEA